MSGITKEKNNSETEENIIESELDDEQKMFLPESVDCESKNDNFNRPTIESGKDNFNRPTIESNCQGRDSNFSWASRNSFDLRAKSEYLVKINGFFSAIFLFRSMVDIGLFAIPYSFGKVGYVLGIVLCVLTTYCSGYGIYIVSKLANDVEDELFMMNEKKKKIHTFNDLAMRCAGNAKHIFRGVLVILISMLNISILVGNLANTANFLYEVKGIEQWKCKLCLTFVFMIIMFFTVDSSRISFQAMPSTVFLLITLFSMLMNNFYIKFFHKSPEIDSELDNITHDYISYNIDNSFMYMGITMFSFSSIGTLFTVRNSMEDPKSLPKITQKTYTFTGQLVIAIGVSFYWVYGNENLKEVVFDYYPAHISFYFTAQKWGFNLTQTVFLPLYILAVAEQIENFEFYEKFSKDENGNAYYYKILFGRLIGTAMIMSITFVSNDITKLLDVSGSVIMPLIGFMIPIMQVHWKAFCVDGTRQSCSKMIHDQIMFLFGLALVLYGVMDAAFLKVEMEN